MNDYQVPDTIPEIEDAIERYKGMYSEYRGVRWEHVIVSRLRMLEARLIQLREQTNA